MKQGLFLSLDGMDGCGKSTQCRLLADWFRARGHAVTACRDPGGTSLGDQLRQVLLGSSHPRSPTAEALLFMASRAQLVAEVIRPALARGDVVVSDRFLLSTVVYQGHGKGLDPGMLWDVGRLAAEGLEPDLTFVLDLPLEVARARLNRPADRMESLGDDFFRRVREGFLTEARRRPERFRVVNAAPEPEAVHARITQEVSRVLETGPGA
jgi:dTMP kinase